MSRGRTLASLRAVARLIGIALPPSGGAVNGGRTADTAPARSVGAEVGCFTGGAGTGVPNVAGGCARDSETRPARRIPTPTANAPTGPNAAASDFMGDRR